MNNVLNAERSVLTAPIVCWVIAFADVVEVGLELLMLESIDQLAETRVESMATDA